MSLLSSSVAVGMENSSPRRSVRFDVPSKQLPEPVTNHKPQADGSADFEEAIAACGYGKFHYLLFLLTLLSTWGVSYDTSNTAYLLPAAECDLSLSHFDKGLLNAAVYFGMMGSAYFWGFLADTTGRIHLLIIGTVLDALCNLAAIFSQTFWYLLLLKCIGGFVSCGPMVVLPPYLAEFHGEKHRPQAIFIQGLFLALAQFTVPVVAWLVIPLPWEWSWTMYGFLFKFNSWRLYLLVCLVPGLLAAILLLFFDESPKFLMASGRHQKALQVFRRVYAMNTGRAPDTYPVKVLRVSMEEGDGILTLKGGDRKSALEMLKVGIKQAKPLFVFPLLPWALLVYALQFGTLLGVNTLRLWIPQLFATMSEFTSYQTNRNITNKSAPLCEMLSFNKTEMSLIGVDAEDDGVGGCSTAMLHSEVYVNIMIVAAVCAVVVVSVSFVIKIVGKKNILVYCFFVGGVAAPSIFWSRSAAATLSLSTIYIASLSTCGVAVLSVTVDLFPTSLRTMAVSLVMMAGEMGATIGNMLFPVFLDISCILPFFLLGVTSLVCGVLSLLLPSHKKKEES